MSLAPVTVTNTSLQIELFSVTGDRLVILDSNSENGSQITCTINEEKNGGISDFTFQLPRKLYYPISKNTLVNIYFEGSIICTGYVQVIPDPSQTEEILTYNCNGFMKKLTDIKITRTYTSDTDSAMKNLLSVYILDTVATNDIRMGILYDSAYIDLPSTNIVGITLHDMTLKDAIEYIMSIANSDYNTAKYRYYIDTDRYIKIVQYGEDIEDNIFESYDFNEIEIETDSSEVVNQIDIYKATTGDAKVSKYVDTIEDADSIAKNGVKYKKMIFPNECDDADATLLATYFIERYKNTQKKISMKNLETKPAFDYYSISSKKDEYLNLVTDMEKAADIGTGSTGSGWDFSNFPNAGTNDIEKDSTRSLTGRYSTKFTVDSGNLDSYFTYTPQNSNKYPFPDRLRFYIYYESEGIVQITFRDTYDNQVTKSFGKKEVNVLVDGAAYDDEALVTDDDLNIVVIEYVVPLNRWVMYDIKSYLETETQALYITSPAAGTDDVLGVTTAAGNDELAITYLSNAGVLNIAEVEFKIKSDDAFVFSIDRVEVINNSYGYNKELLEKVTTEYTNKALKYTAEFGSKQFDLIDELNKRKIEMTTINNLLLKE